MIFKKKIWIFIGILVFVLIGIGFRLMAKKSGPTVDVSVAKKAVLENSVEIYGVLEAENTFEKSLPIGEQVVEVFVEEGERVKKGQTLAKLDTKALEIQQEKLLVQQQILEKNLEMLLEEKTGSSWQERQNEVYLAQNRFVTARAKFEESLDKFTETERLYSQAKIPYDEFRSVEISFLEAKNQYETARLNDELSKKKFSNFEKDLTDRIRIKEQEIAGCLLDQEDIRNKIEDRFLYSEIDGLLSVFDLKSNEWIDAKNQSVIVIDESAIKLTCKVYQEDAVLIETGQSAVIQMNGRKEVYQGVVSKVQNIAKKDTGLSDEMPKQFIEISFKEPYKGLVVGYEADAEVIVKKTSPVVYVAKTAIGTDEKGIPFLYGLRDGRVVRQSIELGFSADIAVEVKRGIEEGQVYILNVQESLDEGMKVKGNLQE